MLKLAKTILYIDIDLLFDQNNWALKGKKEQKTTGIKGNAFDKIRYWQNKIYRTTVSSWVLKNLTILWDCISLFLIRNTSCRDPCKFCQCCAIVWKHRGGNGLWDIFWPMNIVWGKFWHDVNGSITLFYYCIVRVFGVFEINYCEVFVFLLWKHLQYIWFCYPHLVTISRWW